METQALVVRLLCAVLLPIVEPLSDTGAVAPVWHGVGPRDLHAEYSNIFRHGNRNAASHLWSSFIFERGAQMTAERFEEVSKGYCAVSGSPTSPHDYSRYRLRLPSVKGTGIRVEGFMYYCCWPCVCDTQDFIKIDTVNVSLANGVVKRYHVAVLGNPCLDGAALDRPFKDIFGWGGETSIRREAPEVRCDSEGNLIGATLSDHGYPIISLFFDSEEMDGNSQALSQGSPQPGRLSSHEATGLKYQDEFEFRDMCEDRARQGYNSGMGEIFRKVAAVTMIDLKTPQNDANPSDKLSMNQSDL